MMDVSIEHGDGLWRRMKVALPAAQLQKELEDRLQRFKREARVPGFRPGKAPLKLIEQRFGEEAFHGAVENLISSSYPQALAEVALHPVGRPRFEPGPMERGRDLEYVVHFEVFPEIAEPTLAGCTVEKVVSRVEESDVDGEIEKLRRRCSEWRPVERVAREGDRAIVNFSGAVDGKPFKGGEGCEQAVAVSGEETTPPSPGEALMGAARGDKRSFTMPLPETYDDPELRGKEAHFELEVTAVMEPELPALDAAFVESIGIKGVSPDDLRSRTREALERKMNHSIKQRLHAEVLRQLLARHTIAAPSQLVEEEMVRLLAHHRHARAAHSATGDGDAGGGEQDEDDGVDRRLLEREAGDGVRVGLLMAEVIKARALEVDESRLRERIRVMTAGYEDPEKAMGLYMSDQLAAGFIALGAAGGAGG